MTCSDENARLEKRIVALEESMMYADRMLKQLNEVVLDVQERLDQQQAALVRLTEMIDRLSVEEDEPRDPLQEKPPHY